MSKLNPCPFCGGEAKLESDAPLCLVLHWVICSKCSVRTAKHPNVEKVIKEWNSRAGGKLICQINVDGEEILRKAVEKVELDGKTLAEWIELAKGYKQLEQDLAAVKRERDAAVADMKQAQGCICNICKSHYRPIPTVRRYECKILGKFSEIFNNDDGGALLCGKFEWCGVCPENTEVQEDG